MTSSIFQRAIDAWGQHFQIEMMVEECAELIVALKHAQRNERIDKAEENENAIITEIADVQIMLEQMKLIFGKNKCDLEWARKLKRLDEKLKAQSG